MNTRPDLVLVDGSSYLYRAFHALPPFTQLARRTDRRRVRRAEHAREVPQGLRPGTHRRGVRRPRQDFPRRAVRRVQGAPPADARRPALADPAAVRRRARRMGLPILRETGVEADDVIGTLACARREAEPQRADLHRRQGHGAAGVAADHAHQHHEQHGAGSRRRQEQVRRLPRADHRLPRAGGRQLGQHPGHRQGGTEDRGQVAGPVQHARRAGGRRRQRQRQGGREPARRSRHAGAGAQARHHPHRPHAAGVAGGSQAPARRTSTRCARCTRGWSCARCSSSSMAAPPAGETAPDAPAASGQPRHRGARRRPPGIGDGAQTIAAAPRQLRNHHDRGAARRLARASSRPRSCSPSTPRPPASSTCRREIVGVSFAVAPGKAAYLPLRHDYAGAPDQLDRDASLAKLKPLLESEKHAKVGHHLKYDAHVLAQSRHRAARHALRLDARVLRVEQRGHAPRHGLGGASVISASARFTTKTSPARAPSRSPSARCRSTRRPSIPPRTPTSRCGCTRCCGRRSPACRRCERCTRRSSSRWCRCCCAWKNTACCSTGRCCARRAASWPSASWKCSARRTRRPARPSTSIRPSSSAHILFEKMQLPVVRKTPTGPAVDRRRRARRAGRELPRCRS